MKRVCVFAFSLLLAACGFQAPQPKITTPAATGPALVSTISAELRLPAAEIAKYLNAETQMQIASLDDRRVKCPMGKCQLDLLATRSGPIGVGIEGSKLALALPFNIKAHLRFKLPFMKSSGDADGTGRVSAVSSFSVAPDWELRSKTEGTIEFSHADLRIGPLRAELSDFLNDEQDEIARPIFKEIDAKMPKWANLSKRMNALWAKAHTPIQVGKSPQAWLMLEPQHIFIEAPHGEANTLVMALGVETRARVILGDRPAASKLPPLPAPEAMRGKPDAKFHLQVPAILPYGEAVKLAAAQIAKHPIVIGNSTHVGIADLQIIPSHDDVVVAASFCLTQSWDPFGWFDACGRGYLRGTPTFDTATGTLRITNISYDAGTANLLAGAWRVLSGTDFTDALQQRLVFDLSGQIAKLKDQVTKAFAKGTGGDLTITGQMTDFGAPALSWTTDGFIAAFTAEGQVQVALQP